MSLQSLAVHEHLVQEDSREPDPAYETKKGECLKDAVNCAPHMDGWCKAHQQQAYQVAYDPQA